jgi:molecular chaperone HtpG
VFIKGDCRELLPDYLRFIRGVVDSEDLSLNMSREILQQSRQMEMIRSGLVRRVLSTLEEMKNREPENYRTFWKEFGRVLKEGLFSDEKNREKLLELCLFKSSISGEEWVTLDEALSRIPEGRKEIFCLPGEDRAVLEQSPVLEVFRSRGIEVLFLTDPVDEIWLEAVDGFKGARLRDAAKGDLDLETEEEKEKGREKRSAAEGSLSPLMDFLKNSLSASVREVRLSGRLTDSPACLVQDEQDPSPQFARMLAAMGREAPQSRRILELNPGHPIVKALQSLHEKSPADPVLGGYAQLLYGMASLAEGSLPENAPGISRKLSEFLEERLGSAAEKTADELPK